jgi:hypothetical protein
LTARLLRRIYIAASKVLGAMYYRVYIKNEQGRISGYHELECADDEEAKQKAAQMVDGHDIELWQQGRQVATFNSADKQ